MAQRELSWGPPPPPSPNRPGRPSSWSFRMGRLSRLHLRQAWDSPFHQYALVQVFPQEEQCAFLRCGSMAGHNRSRHLLRRPCSKRKLLQLMMSLPPLVVVSPSLLLVCLGYLRNRRSRKGQDSLRQNHRSKLRLLLDLGVSVTKPSGTMSVYGSWLAHDPIGRFGFPSSCYGCSSLAGCLPIP